MICLSIHKKNTRWSDIVILGRVLKSAFQLDKYMIL